ncbi:hypothetical protein PCASD_07649 [Puccinia coronata f. sp. avenae]|uniref:Uncharacterized protein n=1 Tax=Puccinia coronata f. sp. avenae TaxID=200324 RepID=A0A2N5UN22_9BASI|nr:hypothetical protein PCASD_23168 [Puccinia coronata f. sp. avenae]PLW39161.1 hypothetical protein PCASD_07649 [Puccinia coronata f. sp. avenae]
MYALINDNDPNSFAQPSEWDPMTMHIQCMCHKIALIVNAGLSALLLKTLPPGKAKELVLCFFPVLGRVIEEEEPKTAQLGPDGNQPPTDWGSISGAAISGIEPATPDSKSDYGNADNEGSDIVDEAQSENSENEVNSAVKEKHAKSTKLQELTTKITRSAAQRANFNRVAKDLGLKVAPLIAGYGIRWNIKFQSYQKAVNAREVINRILKDNQEQNGTGVFGNVLFSPRDWKEVDNLNKELEVFVKLTSQMEGNSATGTHVIPKYLKLKESLSAKLV